MKENTLQGWMKKYDKQPEVKEVQSFSSEAIELRSLQKEIPDLKEENEILKKAMHYFAKSPRYSKNSFMNTAPNSEWRRFAKSWEFPKAVKTTDMWQEKTTTYIFVK